MTLAVRHLPSPILFAIAAVAILLGVLAGTAPLLALGIGAGVVAIALPFVAPTVHVVALLVVAVIVPYGVQNRFGFSSGAGLIPFDVLLLGGLARAFLFVSSRPVDRRSLLLGFLLIAFMAGAVAQFVHGLRLGEAPGATGYELRNLAAIGTLLVALPAIATPSDRQRLLVGLLATALLLGVWGLAQWILGLDFGAKGEVGVQEGVAFAEGAGGQILGGRYGYPAAIILCFAVLAAPVARPRLLTAALMTALVLNAVALLLTYQRALWVITVLGVVLVLARINSSQKAKILLWAPVALIVSIACLGTIAPSQLTAARERLLSIGQYESDRSVSYRLTESRHIIAEIAERPLSGSGLAASIWWGRPAERVPPAAHTYSHNAYLWLIWKLGIPVTLILVLMLTVGLATRRPLPGPLDRHLRIGAQAGLVSMCVAGVTAPVFSTLASMAVLGILLALTVIPPAARAADVRPAPR